MLRGVLPALLALLALAACQPVSSTPAVDPATQGFEALPPPEESSALTTAAEGSATTLGFTTGENCQWVVQPVTTAEGAAVLYLCGASEEGVIGLLGPVETVQGQAFSVQRASLAAADADYRVTGAAQLPFTVAQVVLGNGATCVNVGEGSNEIVDEMRISFTCEAASAETAPDAGVLVLVNGLYPGEDGMWTVESGILQSEGGTAGLENVVRAPVRSITAQPSVVTVTAAENGKTIYLTPGQTLQVILESNPTTGYSWSVAPQSTAPLTEAGEPVYLPPAESMPGAGGVEQLHFDVAGAGSGDLILHYARPFETDVEPAEVYTLNVIVALTAAENGSSVAIENGDTLAVMLPANPTTGYSWQVVDNDGAILAQTSDPVTLPHSTALGAGGVQLFTFQGVAPGTMTLQMVYSRPWENNAQPANTYMLTVTVE